MAELLAAPWTAADDGTAAPIAAVLAKVVRFLETCMVQMGGKS